VIGALTLAFDPRRGHLHVPHLITTLQLETHEARGATEAVAAPVSSGEELAALAPEPSSTP
jgi:hypothetical protein